MKVEILSERTTEAYEQYLLSKRTSLFYHSLKYKEFLKALLGCEEHYLLAMGENGICGVLPLMFMEGDGGCIYNSLPYFGSNGDFLTDNESAFEELTGAYNESARSSKTLSATVISNPFSGHKKETVLHNYIDWRIAQYTELGTAEKSPADLLSRIDSSARRNLRKAVAEGVTVEIDHNQLNALRVMHQENIRTIGGIPKTDTFFSLVSRHFLPGEDYHIYIAKKEGVVIAALLVFYFNRTVEYFTPAIHHDYRAVQPMAAILIAALQDATHRGFAVWNWGGTWTSQEGVFRFKKKWGAAEDRYCYYTQLNKFYLLDWPPNRIRETFPHFFVVPFSALNDKSNLIANQKDLCLKGQPNHN